MAGVPAGLPAGVRVSDHISLGVIAKTFPPDRVRQVLAETGKASERERGLPAQAMVYCAIAMALYMGSSTREVLRCLLEGLRWLWGTDAVKVAGKGGISQARGRLGEMPLRRLHGQAVQPFATRATKGAWCRGWRLVSLDGSSLDVADTAENGTAFGYPGSSRGESAFPQLRFVALDEAYALGDLHIAGDLPETDFHIFSSPHGFMGLFPMSGGRFRLIASNPISKPEKGTEPSLAELQGIYDQRSHIPARFHDMTWSSWFRINSRMVPRLKIGRLLLGGDSAHIHSPAGAQGMNTGIQDMVNLGWKLALVMQGKAPAALLDTYEQDRLPVMRNVLFKTENLTGLIGSENPVVRSVFNHLGPYIGGSELMQENSTAWMSQVAVGYRDSPLSSDHAHGGALHAGDRVPDIRVRHRTAEGWAEAGLLELLDPSRFVLLVAHGSEADMLDPELRSGAAAYADLVTLLELAPPADASAKSAYEAALGRRSGVFVVRPDGYAGLASGSHSAARQLAEWRQRWLSPKEMAHAA